MKILQLGRKRNFFGIFLLSCVLIACCVTSSVSALFDIDEFRKGLNAYTGQNYTNEDIYKFVG